MNDRTEKATQQHLFLHHFSPEEKTKIFQECQIKLSWHKNNIIRRTENLVRQREELV
ncbi:MULTISPECIES: hypothetical protein [Spirulina sp. CCY15215]|uniref:hypothetical protein n=1 Tax=Spirulina sp. CCY15215 TaxID=2767591 RepID=UPI00194DDDAA|nr:hypothetical protein [Spirulina major]